MARQIKFLSLTKSELEYEVAIRGETPATTVQDLRKQIAKLGPLFPSDDIMVSSIQVSEDLMGISTILNKVKCTLDSADIDKNVLQRTQNILNHLYHRLNRIECTDDETESLHQSYVSKYKGYAAKCLSMKDGALDPLDTPNNEPTDTPTPVNITVSCDRGGFGELAKLKYDGKSCVRTFIQRSTEFCSARNIENDKILTLGTEIFTGDALHWFRSIKDSVSSWEQLVALLQKDFDQSDYDYRLLSEIRSRTQGETENITIYLSIMSGMFSRLSKKLSEEEKLEIILHNIRPTYASCLVSVPEVKDIDSLRSICRHYENIQARLVHFHEPSKLSTETLAPEFSYTNNSNKNRYNQRQNFNTNNQHYNNNNNKPNNFYKNSYNNNSYKNINNNQKNLDAIDLQDIDQTSLDAINLQNNENKRFCPRCRVNTHNLRQCTASKDGVFCFVCGRKDVKTPDCPVCAKNKASTSKN